MFRRSRRQRHGGASEGSPPPSRPPGLSDLLREIAAAASAPEDALEPALRVLLEASGARAGAICLFDPRQSMLRLAAEVGLSDDGCRRLRNVRRSDPATWDMPLHGLLNRRAYLIESASRNRYVPRLIEGFSSVRSVACVPFYSGPTPLGSVVLIAVAPRSFVERDIHALERPLREVARIVQAARRQGAGDGADPRPAARPAVDIAAIVAERDRLREEIALRVAEEDGLGASAGEIERLQASLGQAADERARLAAELERATRAAERAGVLTASLAAAEEERARLAAALEAAAAERAEQARTQSALERARAAAERAAATAAVELEAARRAAAESTAAAVRRAAERAAEAERLQTRLGEAETALARERELVRDREREHERLTGELRAATAREERMREELGAAMTRAASGHREDLRSALAKVQLAEEAHATARVEAEAARAALSSAHAVVEALEEEAERAHAEIERLGVAEAAERSEHERLESCLEATARRAEEAEGRLAEVRGETSALREECTRLEAAGREREAEFAALTAHMETLAAERDRLREVGEGLAAERAQLAQGAELAAAAQVRLEEALARETAERMRLAAAFEALERERARRPAEALAPAPAGDPGARGAGAGGEGGARPREVRVVTVAPAASRGRVRELDTSGRLVVVLDTDAGWERAAIEGHQVTVLPPGEDALERLADLVPVRIVANLAAERTLETLAALRAAGSTARFWGCLALPAAERALPIGMVEAATRPIDPDAILAALGTYAARGTRVVTAGADVDELMSLRQALSRRRMSVSMAWDGKQATDLLGVVRPEIVVVDLELGKREGYAIVARLGAVSPIAIAVVIPASEDAAAGFAAVAADPEHTSRAIPLDRLIADTLGRSEAPASERRPQKLRALGRK